MTDKDNCEICNTKLTDVEQKAKDESKSEAWCCYECIGDGSMGLTVNGKYHILLSFVKKFARLHLDIVDHIQAGSFHCDVKDARDLLEEIGELND